MRALLPRDQYEALRHSRYLNQASLGLIPRESVEAMTAFLGDVAQHGNVRMSDAAEARVLGLVVFFLFDVDEVEDGIGLAVERRVGKRMLHISPIGGRKPELEM